MTAEFVEEDVIVDWFRMWTAGRGNGDVTKITTNTIILVCWRHIMSISTITAKVMADYLGRGHYSLNRSAVKLSWLEPLIFASCYYA